ncbi:hypothetical protein CVT24_005820 [Panaeolus cyanescens]|uniref:NAD(P)-binding domain-containing protein n=1 Tax=Panaeolus cyanescens TaxID=181874 RepID=A0A409VB44_9AGAR|nr:hypothetical protein CVT24_005820 [Panaeolus cyanescens]
MTHASQNIEMVVSPKHSFSSLQSFYLHADFVSLCQISFLLRSPKLSSFCMTLMEGSAPEGPTSFPAWAEIFGRFALQTPNLREFCLSKQAPKTALILGATGQTGQHLLKSLLASSEYSRVAEYGRRVTPSDDISTGKDKLEQKVIDFEKLQDSDLKKGNWDVVFITLGTTRANAGSAEAFEKIDREYVINAAKEAKSDDPALAQRLVYLSSTGANANSPFLYPKSKGLTEIGLAKLGYADTIVFRPAALAGTHRPESRIAESVLLGITSVLSRFSDRLEIKVSDLGRAIALAGIMGSKSLPANVNAKQEGPEGARFTVIDNPGALKLAALDK